MNENDNEKIIELTRQIGILLRGEPAWESIQALMIFLFVSLEQYLEGENQETIDEFIKSSRDTFEDNFKKLETRVKIA
jgi:hypothetical protein